MSHVVRKPPLERSCASRKYTNWPAQLQKLARLVISDIATICIIPISLKSDPKYRSISFTTVGYDNIELKVISD